MLLRQISNTVVWKSKVKCRARKISMENRFVNREGGVESEFGMPWQLLRCGA